MFQNTCANYNLKTYQINVSNNFNFNKHFPFSRFSSLSTQVCTIAALYTYIDFDGETANSNEGRCIDYWVHWHIYLTLNRQRKHISSKQYTFQVIFFLLLRPDFIDKIYKVRMKWTYDYDVVLFEPGLHCLSKAIEND